MKSDAMVEHEEQFVAYFQRQSLMHRDRFLRDPHSCVAYLRAAAHYLGEPISARNCRSEGDVKHILKTVMAQENQHHESHYRAALRDYAAMVQENEVPSH